MDYFKIIKYTYLFLGFTPLILCFFYYKKGRKFNDSLINFLPFIILMFFATIVELNFFKFNVRNWIRLYDFLEFYTLLAFFYKELRFKKLYSLFALGYFTLFIYLLLFKWDNKSIADQPLIISSVILVLTSVILWFMDVFKNFDEKPLYKRTGFYFVGVILLYILSTSLSFLSIDFFWENNRENSYILQKINYLFNILSRIIVVLTIYKSFELKGNNITLKN